MVPAVPRRLQPEELEQYLNELKTSDAAIVQSKLGSLSSSGAGNKDDQSGDQNHRSAEELKDKGNAAFKAGKYADAVRSYTASISKSPSCLAYANRALAHLKLKRLDDAERDCTSALHLDPTYVKAYQRRGTARKELGDYTAAAQDFETAVLYEPNNKQAVEERRACLQKVAAHQPELVENKQKDGRKRKECIHIRCGGQIVVVPASLKEVDDGDDGIELDVEMLIPQQQQQQRRKQEVDADADFLTPSSTRKLDQDEDLQSRGGCLSGSDANIPQAIVQIVEEESKNDNEAPLPPLPSGLPLVPPESSTGLKPKPSSSAKESKSIQEESTSLLSTITTTTAAAPAVELSQTENGISAEKALKLISPSFLMKTPKTGVEFEKAWKSFKGDISLQSHYLCWCVVPIDQVHLLFKHILTPGLLAGIVKTLLMHTLRGEAGGKSDQQEDPSTSGNRKKEEKEEVESAIRLLEALPAVPRFDMNVLSMPSGVKKELSTAWDNAMSQQGGEVATKLEQIRKHYKV